MATLDLLCGSNVVVSLHVGPSIFTPLVKTRMEHGQGVREQDLSSSVASDHEGLGRGLSHRFADDVGQAVVQGRRPRALGGAVRRSTARFTWPLVRFSGVVGTMAGTERAHLPASPCLGSRVTISWRQRPAWREVIAGARAESARRRGLACTVTVV